MRSPERTLARSEARRVYNALGSGLDRAARFESRAKAFALDRLALAPGQRVLQVGVGTGGEHAALSAATDPGGTVVGLDLSRIMLELTRRHAPTPLCEGDAVWLPFAPGSFDRLFCAYTLDLIATAELPLVLGEFHRVLRPGGRMALVSLTVGVNVASRLFVAWWTLGFRLRPERFGGCRPLQLRALVEAAGLRVERRVVVQRSFPSEVLVAERPQR